METYTYTITHTINVLAENQEKADEMASWVELDLKHCGGIVSEDEKGFSYERE